MGIRTDTIEGSDRSFTGLTMMYGLPSRSRLKNSNSKSTGTKSGGRLVMEVLG